MAFPETVPLFIGGEWVQSESTQTTQVINPATQEVLTQVPAATDAEMDRAIASAKATFQT